MGAPNLWVERFGLVLLSYRCSRTAGLLQVLEQGVLSHQKRWEMLLPVARDQGSKESKPCAKGPEGWCSLRSTESMKTA